MSKFVLQEVYCPECKNYYFLDSSAKGGKGGNIPHKACPYCKAVVSDQEYGNRQEIEF